MEIGKNNRIEQTPIHNLNLPANPHGYWLFGSLDFQSGNMISSQPRYDLFDTAADAAADAPGEKPAVALAEPILTQCFLFRKEFSSILWVA